MKKGLDFFHNCCQSQKGIFIRSPHENLTGLLEGKSRKVWGTLKTDGPQQFLMVTLVHILYLVIC